MGIRWVFCDFLVGKMIIMELRPSAPPGNAQRKLRGFESEIARLRFEGYTIEAIRQALEDVGIKVGWATVQREAVRLDKPVTGVKTPSQPVAIPPTAPQPSKPSTRPAVDVDSFFDTKTANPLFRRKGQK